MSKRVADIVVKTLEDAGVGRCYGIVGDTLNYVTTAISKSKISWVHMRHEEAGAFAAGADAYLTGEIAACAGSCGPGSLHFINGIFEANRNRAPMVLIASQLASGTLGTAYPQEVDFRALYSHCSVFCEQVLNPEDAQRITAQACQAAIAKKGVAVIILPSDISEAFIKNETQFKTYRTHPVIRPSDSELSEVASLLAKGKKVGIFVGAGVKGAHDEVIELAKKLKSPIGHSTRAKDFIEYDNPYDIGMTGMLGGKPCFTMMEECDTLLLLGTDFAFSQFYPNKATLIQIDEDASRLGHRHPVELGLVGDIKASVEALLPIVAEKSDISFLDHCLKINEEHKKEQEKEVQEAKSIIHPQRLVSLISEHADDDAVAVADCGTAMVWVLRHFKTNGKRRTLSSLLHGSMANAMPQALGIKKAYPDRQVISISGDGGLSMLMGELLTAVQEKINVKIVVLNNASLNFVELEQKAESLVNEYTDLKNPDFAKMAEVIGFGAWRVEKPEQLENAIKEFLAYDGPALLDVLTSGYELVMPPEVSVSEVKNMALYGVKAVLKGRVKEVKDLLVDNFVR